MKRYRKRPVIIEAIRIDDANVGELKGIAENNPEVKPWFGGKGTAISHLTITTPEGVMRGDNGDYLVRGIKGEWYSCKPHIFEESYEEVSGA